MTIPHEAIEAAVKALDKATRKVPCPENDEIARAVLEAAVPLIIADVLARVERGVADGAVEAMRDAARAERQRLRRAFLGCRTCGAIHQEHEAEYSDKNGRTWTGTSWAAPDGHPYRPRFTSPSRDYIADLLREET